MRFLSKVDQTEVQEVMSNTYIVLLNALCECLWCTNLPNDFGKMQKETYVTM